MIKNVVIKNQSTCDRFIELKGKLVARDRKNYSDEEVLKAMLDHIDND